MTAGCEKSMWILMDRTDRRHIPEPYHIIMGVHTLDIPLLESAAERMAKPILRVISDYGIEGDLQIRYRRLLVLHPVRN